MADAGFEVAFSMRAHVRYTSKRRRRVPSRNMERCDSQHVALRIMKMLSAYVESAILAA